MEAEVVRQKIEEERQRAIAELSRVKTPTELYEDNARAEWAEATKDAPSYNDAMRLAMNTHLAGLKYWARLGRKKILRDVKPKFELSRVAGIIMEMVNPQKNFPEWIPSKSRKKVLVFDENNNLVQVPEKHKIKTERLLNCGRQYSTEVGIEAHVSPKTGEVKRVGHSGRLMCNLPHACAICAGIESVKDTKKTARILRYASKQDYDVIFSTLTAPHTKYTRDLEFVEQLLLCLRLMRKDPKFEELRDKYGIEDLEVGATVSGADIPYIKSFEVTLGGENGAHYHFHLLVIYDSHGKHEEAYEDMTASLHELWDKYAVRVGLVAAEDVDPVGFEKFHETGFYACRADINDKDSREKTAAYITKLDSWGDLAENWGAAAEISGGVHKLAKGVGYAPFEMLTKIIVSDIPELENAKTEEEIKAAKRELWDDMLAWVRYICASWKKKIVDFSNGLASWDDVEEAEDAAFEEKLEKITVGALDEMQYSYLYNLGLVPYIKPLFMKLGIEGGKKELNGFLRAHNLGECHSAEELAVIRAHEAVKSRETRKERSKYRAWKRAWEKKEKAKAKEEARARKLAEKEAEKIRKKEERERKKALARAPVQQILFEPTLAGGLVRPSLGKRITKEFA